MKENEYKCSACNKLFRKGWTDEEAAMETIKNGFENIPPEDMAIICEDCYNNLMNNSGYRNMDTLKRLFVALAFSACFYLLAHGLFLK
jgi:DNA-directed RNA polymerase subunit RPC12/RpoP